MYKEAGVGAVLAANPRPPLLVPERETSLLTCNKAVRNCEYKKKLSVISEDTYPEAMPLGKDRKKYRNKKSHRCTLCVDTANTMDVYNNSPHRSKWLTNR